MKGGDSKMRKDEVLQLLATRKAIIRNTHVVYTSGKHGSAYINKDLIFFHPDDVIDITEEMARMIHQHQDADIEVVVGPTVGGALLAQGIAYELKERLAHEVLAVYADEVPGPEKDRILKRGYDKVVVGKRCLIVDDVVTTGGSVKKTKAAVEKAGGNVVAIIVICNRGNITAEDLGVENFFALLKVDMISYPADECPLCRDHIQINTEIGHGAQFVAEHGQP